MIYKVKVAVIGDYAVGKSSMLNSLQNKKPYLAYSTMGVDFLLKNFTVENKTYKFHIWDTAGQERFRSIVRSYFRDLDVAILMYDVTNLYALDNLEKWLVDLEYINEKKNFITILVANKIDSPERYISKEDGEKLAEKLNIPYFEMCSYDIESVKIFFQKIVEMVDEKHTNLEIKLPHHYESLDIVELNEKKKIKKKKISCCQIL